MPTQIAGTGIVTPAIDLTTPLAQEDGGTGDTRAYELVSGTPVTASGVTVGFTGIPSWAKRITVMLAGVSTSGLSPLIIQLGDSGGIESAGYTSVADTISNQLGNPTAFTTGIALGRTVDNAWFVTGQAVLTKISGNTWVASYVGVTSGILTTNHGSGFKTLSDVLTQLRITTVNGTDTFDAGSINIMWE